MVLSEISTLCLKENVSYIIVGGDFKTDFTRANQVNTQMLNNFLKDETLENCLYSTVSNVDYTYCSQTNGVKSIIDHLLYHEGDDLSDHSAIC